jgi:hypothetical protein
MGHDADLVTFGTIVSFAAIFVINIFSAVCWQTWTWITHMCLFASLAFWIIFVLLYSSLSVESPVYGSINVVFTSSQFYLGVFICIVVSFLPIVLIKFIQQSLYPNDTDIIKEIIHLHKDYNWEEFNVDRQNGAFPKESQPFVSNTKESKSMLPIRSSIKPTDRNIVKTSKSDDKLSNMHTPHLTLGSKKDDPQSSCDGFATLQNNAHLQGRANGDNFTLPTSLGKAIKKAGGFFSKKMKGKFPIIGPSLTYMGKDGGEVPNSGYAFSQDTGMRDLITPFQAVFPIIEEEETAVLEKKPKKNRSFSSLIRMHIAFSRNLKESNKIDNPDSLPNAKPRERRSTINQAIKLSVASKPKDEDKNKSYLIPDTRESEIGKKGDEPDDEKEKENP